MSAIRTEVEVPLRPRYSLRTLLVLTALIAGGVKLWRGPHHVEERTPGLEREFTFTRDWRGEQIIDGPIIQRFFEGPEITGVHVSYSRHGTLCDWWIFYGNKILVDHRYLGEIIICPLTEEERRDFDQARDAELQRHAAAGIRFKHCYGISTDSKQRYPSAFIRPAVSPESIR